MRILCNVIILPVGKRSNRNLLEIVMNERWITLPVWGFLCSYCPVGSEEPSRTNKSKFALLRDILAAVKPLGFFSVDSLVISLLSCLLPDECFEVLSGFCATTSPRIGTQLRHFLSMSKERQESILKYWDSSDDHLGELAVHLRFTQGQQDILDDAFGLGFGGEKLRRWKEACVKEADFKPSPSNEGYYIPLDVFSMFEGFGKKEWRDFDSLNSRGGKLMIPINLQFDGGGMDKRNGAVLGKVIRGDDAWVEGGESVSSSFSEPNNHCPPHQRGFSFLSFFLFFFLFSFFPFLFFFFFFFF